MKERPYSEYASNTGLRNARNSKNNDETFRFLKINIRKESQSKFFSLNCKSFVDGFIVYDLNTAQIVSSDNSSFFNSYHSSRYSD